MIDVTPYEAKYYEKWQDFVKNSNNGNMFHDLDFFDYHPKDRFEHRHLLFWEKNKLIAVLTGTDRIESDKDSPIYGRHVYVSHSGASFGGFVLPIDSGIRDAHNIVDATLEYLTSEGYVAFQLTPPPLFYSRLPHNHIEFALMRRGFEVVKSELTSIVHFGDSIEKNFDLFKQSHRTATRKAEKLGVDVRFTDRWEEFYHILEHNLALRHNVTPTHTLEEIYKLEKIFPNRIKLMASFKDDVMLGGVTPFIANNKMIQAFYISHLGKYQKFRPLNLLFFKIIEWGIENGFRALDFGLYTVNMEPNFGLGRFKEGFGARGLFRTTWKKIL